MVAEKDVFVTMRDGVKICADVYRPDTTEKLPALLAISIHNKDLQGPEMAETGFRSRPGRRCGPARRKRAIRASWFHAATSTSSRVDAASPSRRAVARALSTVMT